MKTIDQAGSEPADMPVELPIQIHTRGLADELKGGEDISAWVEKLRRTYPQDSQLKTLSSY